MLTSNKLTTYVPEMNPLARLRELIIYIAWSSKDDPKFGKTKLVKLLYFADFSAFRELGKPLTGHRYVKLPNGPFPDNFDNLLGEMDRAGDISVTEDPYGGFPQPKILVTPRRKAVINDYFTADEIALVHGVLRHYWSYSGSEMALLTHGVAWRVAEIGEAIPYEASIISDRDLTQNDLAAVEALIAEYGEFPE